ncbi:MAG: IS66 family insertion sequence element accessory protein TnpB [Ignavibacteria bacterium]|nr:IS66 family insertion sequence element accessory protein TnpB [Ignavibacteria bacterium]
MTSSCSSAACACTSRPAFLYWDGDGFVPYYKRLEKGRFDFPITEAAVRELKRDAARFC